MIISWLLRVNHTYASFFFISECLSSWMAERGSRHISLIYGVAHVIRTHIFLFFSVVNAAFFVRIAKKYESQWCFRVFVFAILCRCNTFTSVHIWAKCARDAAVPSYAFALITIKFLTKVFVLCAKIKFLDIAWAKSCIKNLFSLHSSD